MIRIPCPGCDKTLRIPDAMTGRGVACPQCKHKFRVPELIEPKESDEDADERISTAPPARPAKPRKPRPPVEEEDEPLPKPKRSRAEEDDDQDANTFESESAEEPTRSRLRGKGSSQRRRRSLSRFDDDVDDLGSDKRAHRGGLILTLGILSIVVSCCPLAGWILGGITMSMGATDTQLMDRNVMERSGRGMTKAGQICGIIGVFLGALAFAMNSFLYHRSLAR